MKEDYLWDKKGSDSEIENLENTLKAFRQKDFTPPELPQKTFVIDKKDIQNESPRRFFQFAFAGFASLALVIISLGAFQILNNNDQALSQNTSEQDSDKETILEKPVTAKKVEVSETKNQIIEPKIEKAKFTPKPKRKVKKRVQSKSKRNQFVAKKALRKSTKNKPKVETIKLTKEEKDAYDQLMRALAITGLQMRIVQGKIKGEEEKPAVKKDGR